MHRLVVALHETLDEGWDIIKQYLDVYGGIYQNFLLHLCLGFCLCFFVRMVC